MPEPTDREKLSMRVRSTISYHFGSICDAIKASSLDPKVADALCSQVRRHGNDSVNVIDNHLEFYNISRNHRKDEINTRRVVERAIQEG